MIATVTLLVWGTVFQERSLEIMIWQFKQPLPPSLLKKGEQPNFSNVNKKKRKRKVKYLGSYTLECKYMSLGEDNSLGFSMPRISVGFILL
jgi:hypothetical protein